MFRLIKKVFVALLSLSGSLIHIAKVSERTKCISLKNEPHLARPTRIDLNSNVLPYYQFMAFLDRCNGSCNTLDHLSSRKYI